MSKHPEFVQSLVLKPWTRQMYLNYISLKKKKKTTKQQQTKNKTKSSCRRSVVLGIFRRRKCASVVLDIDVL